MTNPYSGLDDFCFWSRAVTSPAPAQIDPCVEQLIIGTGHKVATLGSCFAQHLGRYISSSGLNYYAPEVAPPSTSPQESLQRNYGVFSARYGNVYTARQAVQLFDRAFGLFTPSDHCWTREGRFVDAFRPQVEPDGFPSPQAVADDRADHLGHVRDVFMQSDWIIFTLGLTEGWRSKSDGAMYPSAPGVAGGTFDPLRHEFVNFSPQEVIDDLSMLIEKIADVNPRARIILTVSPVPLIATYERRHVLVSTCYSKAALRVAADAAERRYSQVVYFPSYEIITSPAAAGRYFADDLRQVTELGVKHVMRVFSRHFFPAAHEQTKYVQGEGFIANIGTDLDVVCDEVAIERALLQSGISPSHTTPTTRASDAIEGVHALPDVAIGKPATQSSRSYWSLGATADEDAMRANNGERMVPYAFHTDKDEGPWWQVDLLEAHDISQIVLLNRMGAADVVRRADPIEVLASVDTENWIEVFRTDERFRFGEHDEPLCWTAPIPILARFIRVRIDRTEYLHLGQVQIRGRPRAD